MDIEYVVPILAFLFVFALIVVQQQRRSGVPARRALVEATDTGPSWLGAVIKGRPPATQPIDHLVRALWYLAMVSAAVGVVIGGAAEIGGFLVFTAPTGVLLVINGLLMLTNYRGVLDRMYLSEEQRPMVRLTGQNVATRQGALACLVVGLGWTAIGIGEIVRLV